MALDLTALSVPLLGGLDLKTSKFLVKSSRALVAQNVVQKQPGKVEKRYGFAPIKHPAQTSCNWVGVLGTGTPGSTSLGQELLISGVVGGGYVQSGWSPASNGWLTKGQVQPIAVTEKVAFAGSVDCTSVDVALNKDTPTAGGCYSCYAYQKATGSVNFIVYDDNTGQTVMQDQVVVGAGGSPRVVSIGPYFVIFVVVSGTINAYTVNPFQQTITNAPIGVGSGTFFDARAVSGATIGHGGQYVVIASGSGAFGYVQAFDPWAQATIGPAVTFSATVFNIAIGVFASNIGVIFSNANTAIQIQWFSLALVAQNGQTIDSGGPYGKLTLQPTSAGCTAAWETLGVLGTVATNDPSQELVTLPAIKTASGPVNASVPFNGVVIKRNESIGGDLFTVNGITYLPTIYQGNYSTSYTPMQSLQPTDFVLQVTSTVTAVYELSVLQSYNTVASAFAAVRYVQTNGAGPQSSRKCPQVSTDLAGNLIWGIGTGTQTTAAFNGVYQNVRAVARAVCTFGVPQYSETLGADIFLTGGVTSAYDGSAFTEQNFHLTPEPPIVDACTIGCCRVQMGTSSSGFAGQVCTITASDGGKLTFTSKSVGVPFSVVMNYSGSLPGQFNATVVGTVITIYVGTGTSGDPAEVAAYINGTTPFSAPVTAITSNWTVTDQPATGVELPAGTFQSTGGQPNTLSSILGTWTSGGGTVTFAPANPLTPNPITPGTVVIYDGAVAVAQDNGQGVITGTDSGSGGGAITGTVAYATGAISVTCTGTGTGGSISVQWSVPTSAYAEINDVYFPPDSSNPGATIFGSGWQVRPGSYIVITAQSNGPGAAWQPVTGTFGGPIGYIWFSVDGVGVDPVPFTNPGTGPGANVLCALLSTDNAAACAQKFRQAIIGSGLINFVSVSAVIQNVTAPTATANGLSTSKVTVTAVIGSSWSVGAPLAYSEDFRLDPYASGSQGVGAGGSWMSCPPGKKIMPGGYFVVVVGIGGVSNGPSAMVFYYTVNGLGAAPTTSQILLPLLPQFPTGTIPIYGGAPMPIAVNSYSTPAQVAAATYAVCNAASAGGIFAVKSFVGTYDSMLWFGAPGAATSQPWPTGCAPYNVSGSGILPDGTYVYEAVEEWPDAKGQFNQSGPSEEEVVNITGASPTFDPFGYRYDNPLSSLTAPANGKGMLLWGATVGGSSPFLIVPSLWETQKQSSTLAIYRSTVSAGNDPALYRVTDAAQQATITPTSAIVNPNPALPGATALNPLTGVLGPIDLLTFIDTTPDSQAQANPEIYEGEPNAPVPCAAMLHLHRGRMWAVLKENPNQLWYSQVFLPESGFAVNFSEELTLDIDAKAGNIIALGTCDAWLIVFCQYGMYAVGGDGPTAAGQGDFEPPNRIMTDSGGCVAPGSITEQPDGLWYQSAKGFYFMDRNLKVAPEGLDYNTLVTGHTCNAAIVMPDSQEILWFMSETANAAQPASDYALYWSPFTQFKAQHLKRAGSSATLWNGTLVWVDAQGNVNVDTPGAYLDNGAVIPFVYQTAHLGKQAGVQGYLRVRRALLIGEYISPANLKVQISYDYEPWSRQVLGAGQPQDGTRFQWRFAVPPGPTGGRIEAISFIISDYGDGGNMGGFSLSDITLELGVFQGGYRAGVSRTTG